MVRTYFLGVGAGSAASLGLGGIAQVFAKSLSPLRGRFLTHVSVDALGQVDLALPGEQGDCSHFAQIRADGLAGIR